MQLILETIPVIHEEDKEELLKVMPTFINSTWEVRKPLRKLLPEVDSEGTIVPAGSSNVLLLGLPPAAVFLGKGVISPGSHRNCPLRPSV